MRQAGRVNVWLLAVAAAVGGLLFAIKWKAGSAAPAGTPVSLFVWTAASQKGPMEAAAAEFERLYHIHVDLSFGASQTMLANLAIGKKGDLYLPADDSYFALAREKNVLAETFPLARMTARLAVRPGNPKKLQSLADLQRPDVKLAQANPDAAAIGKLVRAALEKAGQWEPIKAHTLVFKGNVNDVANDVKLGSVDAGFVWDAMGRQYPDLEFVRLAELDGVQAKVALGVLNLSAHPAEARQFARWLADPEGGLKIWRAQGYDVGLDAGKN